MSVKYIADLHLYDRSTVNWRDNSTDFELQLIQEWNSVTEEDDIVFIVGDVGRDCPSTVEVVKKLKGIKILVLGNHDIDWKWDTEKYSLFHGIHPYILSNDMLLIHNPMDAKRFKKQWVIHGHLHTYEAEVLAKDHSDYIIDMHRFNCAVDMNAMHPCTLQELMYYKSMYIEEHKT